MYVPAAVELGVHLGAVRLRNSVVAASGDFPRGFELAPLVNLNRLGGLVVTDLSREPVVREPVPRPCETLSGMLNAAALQDTGVCAFVRERLPDLRERDTALQANAYPAPTLHCRPREPHLGSLIGGS